MNNYSVILSNVGSCADRSMTAGYSDAFDLPALFERVSRIPQVKGVELIGNWRVEENNVKQLKMLLQDYQLRLVSIIPDHFGQRRWKNGSFSAKDPAIRGAAVEHAKEMVDVALELGGNLINIWPGQDRYDYVFQADYLQERDWFAEGIKRVCQYRPEVRISMEYKIKEPRTRSYLSTAAVALLMIQEIDAANCGVTIDFGHALNAYEAPAESVALLKKYGNKLFHVHMNDNYRRWDDDMIVGSVLTIETMEFFYWLKKTAYSGWLSIDPYPYREDSLNAVREGVNAMASFSRLIDWLPVSETEKLIADGDATKMTAYLRELFLGH